MAGSVNSNINIKPPYLKETITKLPFKVCQPWYSKLIFSEDKDDLQGEGKIRSIFDPCCGTGGMLTIGKEYVHQNINTKLNLRLLGQ
ncbi:MAG: N-6 DNA methylase, partial [Thermodesulfobacteriota bacterium]